MRPYGRSLVSLLLLLCPVLAKAVTIRIQDPDFTYISSTPYSFSFTACPTGAGQYFDGQTPITSDGCFGGLNNSGKAITSIELTFQNNLAVQNSGANVAASDIFSNASYVAPADPTSTAEDYTFLFSGSSLVEGQTFVITEDGVTDPSQFPLVTLTYNSVTPEPAPLLLVWTGLAGMACLAGIRRLRLDA